MARRDITAAAVARERATKSRGKAATLRSKPWSQAQVASLRNEVAQGRQAPPGEAGPTLAKQSTGNVDLGRQLSRRVASGAISREQAEKTASQRATLKKALGSDWRTQVFGKGGAREIGGPFASREVAAKRSTALSKLPKARIMPRTKARLAAKKPRHYLEA